MGPDGRFEASICSSWVSLNAASPARIAAARNKTEMMSLRLDVVSVAVDVRGTGTDQMTPQTRLGILDILARALASDSLTLRKIRSSQTSNVLYSADMTPARRHESRSTTSRGGQRTFEEDVCHERGQLRGQRPKRRGDGQYFNAMPWSMNLWQA